MRFAFSAVYPARMDFGKIPIDKVAFFIAGIIPGGTAIYVYALAHPELFHDFAATNLIGYRSKLGIALALSFVIGNTITLFVFALGGAIRGGIAGGMNALPSKKPPQAPQTVPWRDPMWRKLAKKYLEDSAPADTLPLSEDDFNRSAQAVSSLEPADREAKMKELNAFRAKLSMDDWEWSRWYSQFADQLRAESSRDFTTVFAQGIRANLQTTGVYLFVSMFFVPALRNWIFISFSLGWILLLAAETYTNYLGYSNPWTTWFQQMEFLAEKTLRQAKSDKAASSNKESGTEEIGA